MLTRCPAATGRPIPPSAPLARAWAPRPRPPRSSAPSQLGRGWRASPAGTGVARGRSPGRSTLDDVAQATPRIEPPPKGSDLGRVMAEPKEAEAGGEESTAVTHCRVALLVPQLGLPRLR